jgi:hypothetical protein
VRAADHRFALNMPALVSAPSKKSFSSVSSPVLACRAFKSTPGALASLLPEPDTPRRAVEKLAFPQRDLVGVNAELLRQSGQRLLALEGGQGHFRLAGRRVVPPCAFRHDIS